MPEFGSGHAFFGCWGVDTRSLRFRVDGVRFRVGIGPVFCKSLLEPQLGVAQTLAKCRYVDLRQLSGDRGRGSGVASRLPWSILHR